MNEERDNRHKEAVQDIRTRKIKIEVCQNELTLKWLEYRKNTKVRPFGCIYVVTHKQDGLCYVGKSINFNVRLTSYNKLGCIQQPKLYNALLKYGIDNFVIEVIDEAISSEQLSFLEIFFIAKHRSRDRNYGYNIQKGGEGEFSKETRNKLSEIGKVRFFSEDHKKRISDVKKGVIFSEEHKKALAESHKDSEKNKEHLKKVQECNKGKRFTEERKQKISETLLKRAPEIYKKTANSNRGKKRTPETCKKISDKAKGRPCSPELCQMRSVSAKAQWVKQKALKEQQKNQQPVQLELAI